MRVIAGIAKGRRLAAPPVSVTRATSDRVREALFSAVQTRVSGAQVADLYAGSGALGIEALSRGAAGVTFVERSPVAGRVLRDNLARTGFVDKAQVLAADVRGALRRGLPGGPFDLTLADPPYGVDPDELAEVLRLVVDAMAPGGLVVVERASHGPQPRWPPQLQPGRVRRYGDTLLYEAHA